MYLYVIGAFDYNSDILAVKIGVSDDVKKRMATLQTGQFCELKLILAWESASRLKCFHVERVLHDKYQNRRMLGEWFRRMVLRDIVQVTNDLMGSIPRDIPGMTSHMAEVRDCAERKRLSNRAYREAKKTRKAELKRVSQV